MVISVSDNNVTFRRKKNMEHIFDLQTVKGFLSHVFDNLLSSFAVLLNTFHPLKDCEEVINKLISKVVILISMGTLRAS
jgi:hypothetical protein